jgi:hypothetical protein
MFEREPAVIDAQQMQHGRMQIANVNPIFDRVVAVYWFSVNWKFAFEALACDGFDASGVTL